MTPIVIKAGRRIGVIETSKLTNQRKLIYFILLFVSALVTPDGNPMTMLLAWIPLVLLFELGVIL
jgi:Sec-independent protein secretion pathway component TatC